MRILFTTSSFQGGGITSYAHELVDNFSKGNDLYIVIGSDSFARLNYPKEKIFYVDCDNPTFDNAKRLLYLINIEIKPDVVINSNAKLTSIITSFISDDIRVISVSHSLKYKEADNAGFSNRYLDHIIALSHFNKIHLDNKFGIKDPHKTVVISNFVDTSPDASGIKELKKNNNLIKIVFSGGGASPKSPEIIIRVLDKLIRTNNDFVFYWLGSTIPPIRKISLINDLKQLFPDDSRIVFTGKLPRVEAQKKISDANIFLFPSKREGCPFSLLEAMRIGTIPIVSDYPNANMEIIKSGENGFVINRNDIDGFVNRIIDIIIHHKEYNTIYDKSYETFKKELTFEVWRKKMEEIVLNNHCSHCERKESFNKLVFIYQKTKLSLMYKLDDFAMRFEENLPTYFSIQKQIIKLKYGKSL